ncbi:hypothetical protein ACWF94_37445 [Streptomyces sp. NPDC055078]
MADIDLSDELLDLERAAWAEIRAGVLTVETAYAVQAAITGHAQANGYSRYEVEAALKRAVRRPEG